MPPSISVVIPLYNHGVHVGRAIKSVVDQDFGDWELVVVDDGSTDRGSEIVGRYSDPRIRLVSQSNRGVAAARNRGVNEAKADWVAFLDADDEWRQGFLSTIQRLRTLYPDCQMCATNYLATYDDGSIRRPIRVGMPPEGWEGRFCDVMAALRRGAYPIASSAVAMSAAALESIGGFPEDVGPSGEDSVAYALTAARFCVAYANTPLAEYHLGSRSERELGQGRPVDGQGRVRGGRILDDLVSVMQPNANELRGYAGRFHLATAIALLEQPASDPRLARIEARRGLRVARLRQPLLFGVLVGTYLPPGLFDRVRRFRRVLLEVLAGVKARVRLRRIAHRIIRNSGRG